MRSALQINENAFVLGYLGSLGTWYMLGEMLDFFIELKKIKPNAILFFVTPDKPEQIIKEALSRNIPTGDILIKPAKRKEVPEFISVFDAGIFFIRPSFSKKGSSLLKWLSCLPAASR